MVTAISIFTPPRPKVCLQIVNVILCNILLVPQSVNVAFMGCEDFSRAQNILITAKNMLGEILSGLFLLFLLFPLLSPPLSSPFLAAAVEFMDSTCMDLVERHLHLHNPISSCPMYVLVETSGSNEEHDKEVSVHEQKLLLFLLHSTSSFLFHRN